MDLLGPSLMLVACLVGLAVCCASLRRLIEV